MEKKASLAQATKIICNTQMLTLTLCSHLPMRMTKDSKVKDVTQVLRAAIGGRRIVQRHIAVHATRALPR
jgi:hypothetical protein